MSKNRKSSLASRFGRWFGKADQSDADRDDVPEALVPFLDVVNKWGATESDSERYELAEKAEEDPQELQELEDFLRAWTPEIGKAYDNWGKQLSLSENKALARFYFTFMLIDELRIKLPPDEDFDHVGELIEQLQDGSSWAANKLADYGEEAVRAIPQLQSALKAKSPKLRIWAHYALARIGGNLDEHRSAIQQFGQRHADEASDAERAMDWLTRSPEQHDINALVDFASSNNIRQLRRLIAITDVDAVDSYGHRALHKAVNEGQKEAVRILLEHGANPNLEDRRGGYCIHDAALQRDGEILSLLIEYGADVNPLDERGHRPLDLATANRRKANVELLQKHRAQRGPSDSAAMDDD